MSEARYRPLIRQDRLRPSGALPLTGGPFWFTHAERLIRGRAPDIVPAGELPDDLLARLTTPRAPLCGLSLARPRLMGIVNLTPDSFSDGGRLGSLDAALAAAREMAGQGADILDLGGESTRPGAAPVPEEEEIRRVLPVLKALGGAGFDRPLSIDTRKAPVAQAALNAGAGLVNDVSALAHDPAMGPLVAKSGVPVCLMHSLADPSVMQEDPRYDDVLLDVYDALEARIAFCARLGIGRARILVDPGIGFGKTIAHNMALLRGIALFHGLGCGVLLGVSRKGFIGKLGSEPEAARRAPGSIALGLFALSQGVQMLRVHDIRETRQAVDLWCALHLD